MATCTHVGMRIGGFRDGYLHHAKDATTDGHWEIGFNGTIVEKRSINLKAVRKDLLTPGRCSWRHRFHGNRCNCPANCHGVIADSEAVRNEDLRLILKKSLECSIRQDSPRCYDPGEFTMRGLRL